MSPAVAALKSQFRALRELEPGWHPYGAPVPNERAIRAAEAYVSLLSVTPLRVGPSAEGGVCVHLPSAEGDDMVEFFNDGEVYRLTSDRKGRIDSRPAALLRELAEAAVERIDRTEREGVDVEAWADQLARDVQDICD